MFKITFHKSGEEEPAFELKTENRNNARVVKIVGKENNYNVVVTQEVVARTVKFKGVDG